MKLTNEDLEKIFDELFDRISDQREKSNNPLRHLSLNGYRNGMVDFYNAVWYLINIKEEE